MPGAFQTVSSGTWKPRSSLLLIHTVEFDPFIKFQLASRNRLQGLMWLKFGRITLGYPRQRNPRTPPCDMSWWLVAHAEKVDVEDSRRVGEVVLVQVVVQPRAGRSEVGNPCQPTIQNVVPVQGGTSETLYSISGRGRAGPALTEIPAPTMTTTFLHLLQQQRKR